MSPPVPVLMYHHVVGGDPGPGDPFTVGADELDEHLAALVAAGRQLRPVGALLDDPSPHDVYLTFDDAFTSFAELVVPLLDAHGAGATVFVPTAWMGSAADWAESGDAAGLHVLSASQVAALPPALVEVGGHGHRHTPLDLLDAATLADELRTSRSMLTEVLGRAPRSIAYPFGYHTAAVRAAAAAAGWSLGCEVGYALHRQGGDPLAVRRLLVGPGTTGPQAVRLVAAGQRGPLRMTATVAARPLHRAVRRRLYRRHSTPGVGRPGATTSPPVPPAAGSGARPDPGTPT